MLNNAQMKPGARNKILNGDVSNSLQSLQDNSFDLIIADPPYGLNKADWDYSPDYGDWIPESLRVLKHYGTMYVFGKPEIIAEHWKHFPNPKRLLTWHVSNRIIPKHKTWQPTSESIVMLWKDKSPFFDKESIREPYSDDYERLKGHPRPIGKSRFGNKATVYSTASGALPRDVIMGPGLSGGTGARESLNHPCQKPLWLLEKLIKASCPVNGLVLDLFAGTATTSVAAYLLGRQFVAVEKDLKWCEVALNRLKKEGAETEIISIPSIHQSLSELLAWKISAEKEIADMRQIVNRIPAQGSI